MTAGDRGCNASSDALIDVEVAYALPEKQRIVSLAVERGTTALAAVLQSGIEQEFDDLVLDDAIKLGVFGKAVSHQHVLAPADRVEIYRPLLIDPKEVRRQRAEKARSGRGQS